jgi:hypothetical protein
MSAYKSRPTCVAQLQQVKLRCRESHSSGEKLAIQKMRRANLYALMDKWSVIVAIGLSSLTVALVILALFMR